MDHSRGCGSVLFKVMEFHHLLRKFSMFVLRFSGGAVHTVMRYSTGELFYLLAVPGVIYGISDLLFELHLFSPPQKRIENNEFFDSYLHKELYRFHKMDTRTDKQSDEYILYLILGVRLSSQR